MKIKMIIKRVSIILLFSLTLVFIVCGCSSIFNHLSKSSYIEDQNTIFETETEAKTTTNPPKTKSASSANEIDSNQSSTPEKVVKEPIEIPEENSEIATEPINDYVEENRVYFDDFSLVIPSNWIYQQFDGSVCFCEESIYNKAVDLGYKDSMGKIVVIDKCDNQTTDINNIPIRHQILGENNGIYYIAFYPTDVEVPFELNETDPDLFNSLTEKLYQERDKSVEVFKTFELNN